MKESLSPVRVAVDSGALFLGMLAWAFKVWVPVLLAVIFVCKVKAPTGATVVAFVIIWLPFLFLGVLLKWMANGMIQRRRLSISFSVVVLILLSYGFGFGHFA